jgi:hypothetical protein
LAPASKPRVPEHGRPRLEYPAVVQFDDGLHLVLRAGWAEPQTRDLGFVRLEPGGVWTERYWCDRWYSIKEVRDSNGVLKGWYADVVRPVRVVEGLSAARQTILRLDEDEFAASGLAESDPAAGRAGPSRP